MEAMAVRESEYSPSPSRAAARVVPVAKSLALYGIEMTAFLVFFAVYFLLRGIAPDRLDVSTANALTIVDMERALHIFWEPAWQREAMQSDTAVQFGNFMYMYMHIPFLVVFGFFIFHADRRKHRVIRNAILLSAFVGIPFYHLLPVTPPRLMAESGIDLGFIDTLASERRPRPGPFTNWYAAIPSYHFGWILLGTIGAWWVWKPVWLRAGAVLFAVAMWWSIVITANHYFLDMVLGAVICTGTFLAALWWERWHDRHEAASKRFLYCDDVRLPC